ncbi:MAG: bifunctional folylpolyglutamate synthase/ dihydrofolate synthase, partial [Gammaproteobacteria bacterium]|nr:bifunctional folylpolyglutamate synthase/ dihydrofolate synthase [Gammaproteobacteria bacterium]
MPSNLEEWLTHISRVHPREIELGLGRVQCIAQSMSLSNPSKVITVAGTNGKGSVVSVMESLLCHAGIPVGAYTSPHLHCFNERIRLQGLPCDEDLICEAFSEIDAIRGELSLSYFEFATLAALWIFRRKRVSVALLEVGLGGRLDAVNVLDPDVSVITAVGLDHQDWLGDSREEIGLEKAGILRQGGNFVCGDPDPPLSVIRKARELSCISLYQGQEFGLRTDEQSEETQWWGVKPDGSGMCASFPAVTAVLPLNVSTALQALASAGTEVDLEQAAGILATVRAPGRQELTQDRMT